MKPAHGGGTADKVGEVNNVGGRGDAGDQVAEVGGAADGFQTLLKVQFVGDGDLVDGLSSFKESNASLVAVGVPVPVEVPRVQAARHLEDGLAVDEREPMTASSASMSVGLKPLFIHRTLNLLKEEGRVAHPPLWWPCSLC